MNLIKGVELFMYYDYYSFWCKDCAQKVIASKNQTICRCENCGHDYEILDISYKDNSSAPLSNLFPHKFVIDGVKCLSMESFIQSLRVEDKNVQVKICEEYTGYMAYKMRLSLPDWRKDGYVYWQGKKILRFSEEYQKLLTKAYDMLFENNVFSFCLNTHKNKVLFHTIGCYDEEETLLTPCEYINQLERLIEKL